MRSASYIQINRETEKKGKQTRKKQTRMKQSAGTKQYNITRPLPLGLPSSAELQDDLRSVPVPNDNPGPWTPEDNDSGRARGDGSASGRALEDGNADRGPLDDHNANVVRRS